MPKREDGVLLKKALHIFALFLILGGLAHAKQVKLRWGVIEGAKGYEIEFTRKGKFVLTEKAETSELKLALRPGRYTFRIRGFDEEGEFGDWSEERALTVPRAPPPTTPVENAISAQSISNERTPAAVEETREEIKTSLPTEGGPVPFLVLARISLLSPMDKIKFSPLIGMTLQLPLGDVGYTDFTLSASGGKQNNGKIVTIVEPGFFLGAKATHHWSFAAGAYYREWLGVSSESRILPSVEVTFTFDEPEILRLRQLSLDYSRAANGEVHADQIRLAFLFQF